MTTRYIHNVSGGQKTYRGVPIADGAFYRIETANLGWYQTSDDVLADLGSGSIRMSNDGVTDYSTSVAANISFLLGQELKDTQGKPLTYYPAFAEKTLPDGSKLFKRLHGVTSSLVSGSNTIIFTVPYTHAKIIGARIVGGEMGDTCNFKILDSTTGTYTTIPNYQLNQYGFDVAIDPSGHVEVCRYDADIYAGMQIKFEYESVSTKTIGVNFDFSEVVAP